ncbi:neuropeptide CCHamide-1 receptor-like [Mizuhopecten yessoensis]|uniref:neuropeptide CCHamide-1 receptor-like n=1 Tax=Mizuhopecten yessoensis TaxID=6573 RepID=UPI000B45D726|nr:neuropeptide CCHamide-1 receptor-like [Mizuhopecten yessoensis]
MEEKLETFCNKTLDDLENCTKRYSRMVTVMNGTQEAHSGPEAVIVPLCFGVVFVIGIIGNLFLLYYVLRKRRLNTPHNCYVVNLAAGDIVMITVALPFISTIYTTVEWPFGETICKLSEFVQTLCTGVTIFSITALSIERYLILSVAEPSGRNKKTLIVIILIWIFALILAIPDLVSANIVIGEPGSLEFCFLYRPTWSELYAQTLTIVKLLFLFVLPLLILTPFYIMIVLTLLKTDRNGHSINSNGAIPLNSESNVSQDYGQKMARHRKIVAILVMFLVAMFVLCWLPRHIFLIWFHFVPGQFSHFWNVFKITGFCLMFANSGINPLAFLLFDSGFRHFVSSCDWCKSTSYRPEVFEDCTSGAKQTIVLTTMAHDRKNSCEV